MRPYQLILLAVFVLLTASCNGVKGSAIAQEEGDARNALPIEDVTGHEERLTAVARLGGIPVEGTAVVTNNKDGGGKVTVTTYNNNGLWQRIKRWWKKLLGYEQQLRFDANTGGRADSYGGIGGRVGAGGTVVMTDNDNGGGTVTVTVFNNNGLFQRIKRWWKKILNHLTSPSTRRLRQIATA